MELTPIHFIDEQVQAHFDTPPTLEKTPVCPNGFVHAGKMYRIVEVLSEWTDFERQGKAARNMKPSHALAAASRGSWGVGRFYFRIKVEGGQVFDIYFDRAPKNADDRKGHWVLYRELA